jgi:hypothetical protein
VLTCGQYRFVAAGSSPQGANHADSGNHSREDHGGPVLTPRGQPLWPADLMESSLGKYPPRL